MKYDVNFKIQIKTEPLSYLNKHRYIKYRIVPSELPWWKRNSLFNPWRELIRGLSYTGGTSDLFDLEDYRMLIFPLKTFGDVCEYLKEQKKIGSEAQRRNERSRKIKIEKGEEWPD